MNVGFNMAKKLSQLSPQDKFYFEALVESMNETWQDDIRQRIKVAQKFGLDLTDDDVLRLIAPAPLSPPNIAPSPIIPVSEPISYPLAQETPQSNPVTKVYGENWIVLQNRLLNAISDLDLNERRLIMFLSPLVRKAVDIDPNQRTFVIKVKEFQEEYNIKGNAYYVNLAESCSSLVNKAYAFWDFGKNRKKPLKTQVSWLTKSVYQEKIGEVHVDLHNDVVEMLTVFDKANPFTKYERHMIISLGSYGIILFELIASCMHQQHKQKAYTIEYLREKFNCVDNYSTATDFKRYVLDRAIKDIEKHTPYRITYTQKKEGRTVTEIVFDFKDISKEMLENKKKSDDRDPNTIDWINDATDSEIKKAPSWQTKGLSDAQINKIAIYMTEFVDANSSKISPTDHRDYAPIFEDWKPMLKDPNTVNDFYKIQELLERQRNN